METRSLRFYKNPHSEWVLVHLKVFGKLIGALYEGQEDVVLNLVQKIKGRRTH